MPRRPKSRHGAQVAFLLEPTPIDDMARIAFAGGVMPQKSTDFYPKLLSGVTIYKLVKPFDNVCENSKPRFSAPDSWAKFTPRRSAAWAMWRSPQSLRPTRPTADKFAAALGIPKATGDWRSLLADPEIDAVHVCTPNVAALPHGRKPRSKRGKHVLCEKPLTMNIGRGARARCACREQKNLAHCVNHNLRFYPVVQQIRSMIAAGELGEILVVNGTYFQDWLLYDTDWNWRADAPNRRRLRAMGDIGSHWMDMIQHLTGLRITVAVRRSRRRSTKRASARRDRSKRSPGKSSQAADYDSDARRHRRFRRGADPPGRARARIVRREPGFGGPQESFRIRNLRDQMRRRLEPGAARRVVDRPSQQRRTSLS